MPDNTAASITGRGEELERALQEGKRWAEANKRPDGGQELVDWQARYAPYRQATREAHEKAPVSALAMATAGDWRRAFKEAEVAPNALGAALALAKRGALIFPCNPEHKGPHDILGRTGGCFWATDDPVEIEAWWTAAPLACIGLLLGRRTGVWAIDIDTGKAHNGVDGIGNLNKLEDDLDARISGRIHITANDGRHMLFKWYDGGPQGKRNPLKIGDVAYEGVEIIGDGAFIIVPPSKLLDGKQYKVHDESIPPAPPKKLVAALKGGKDKEKVKKIREQPEPAEDTKWDDDYCNGALDRAVEALRATGPGTYDLTASVALKIGSIVAGGGLKDEVAWAKLSEAATTGKPSDYLAKVARAYAKGKENPWTPKHQFIKWPDWYGRPLPSLANAVLAIEHLNMLPYFNELTHRVMVLTPSSDQELSEETELNLRMEIRDRADMAFDPGEKSMHQAIIYHAFKKRVHPYRDYLEGLVWDGVRRLGRWMPRYMGTVNNRYTRVVGYCFIVGIVARAYEPGCKQDHTVVLEGGQGAFKSQACRALVSEQYFAGNMPSIKRGVAAMEQVQGKMLIELAEIVALIRSDLEELKAFLTNDKDTFRVAYDKHTHDFKRTVTFIGTTNDYNWLNDPTGGRRFWPVKVGDIELKALERDRDQLFAEAVVSFKRRRKWWPSRRVEARLFAPQQELRQELLGPFDEKVAEVLKGMDEPTLREIGDKLGATSVQDWTQLQSRLAASMRRLKWIPLQTTIDGEKKRFWKRGPDAEPKGNNANSSENKYRDNDEIPF